MTSETGARRTLRALNLSPPQARPRPDIFSASTASIGASSRQPGPRPCTCNLVFCPSTDALNSQLLAFCPPSSSPPMYTIFAHFTSSIPSDNQDIFISHQALELVFTQLIGALVNLEGFFECELVFTGAVEDATDSGPGRDLNEGRHDPACICSLDT